MMNSVLFGKGYWASIVKTKIVKLTNLVLVLDSKTDISVLNGIEVDIAFVCSSTSSHYDVVKWCLHNNIKYIFCTKPFTGDYKKAKELFGIAKRMGANIFIDNLFLFRREILGAEVTDMESVTFYWDKQGQHDKETLYDSLLYHDLYLLLKWSRSNKWRVNVGHVYDDALYLAMTNSYQTCFFEYNVNIKIKEKIIILDNRVINLSYPKHDPLEECIVNMLGGNIDFDLSREVTLGALKLMGSIKRQLRCS